jgi:hypothetical protein
MIHDPQDAAAAGICWLARWTARGRLHGVEGVTTAVAMRHRVECAWCPYPSDVLLAWVEDFNRRDGDDYRISARFRAMPAPRQRELVDRSLYPEGVAA